jgi:membrane-anchored protein YejM (alkaline phosphatase superfamily)
MSLQLVTYYLVSISVLAVFAVLLFGLWTMMRGKSPNLSQKLMRWRVGLQFVAICFIVAYVLVRQHM